MKLNLFVVVLLITADIGTVGPFFQTVFLKRWVLFVFTWWQLNDPAVREFRGVSVDVICFLPVFLGGGGQQNWRALHGYTRKAGDIGPSQDFESLHQHC